MCLTCKVAASKLADALLAARESRQEEEARSDSARSASMFCAISAPVFLQLRKWMKHSVGDSDAWQTPMITTQNQKYNSKAAQQPQTPEAEVVEVGFGGVHVAGARALGRARAGAGAAAVRRAACNHQTAAGQHAEASTHSS
jgi:hypothetical protein